MTRRAKPVTEYSRCRSCGAPILWAKWPVTGKPMPVDAKPVAEGNCWLTLRGGEYGQLLLSKAEPTKDALRNRYTSHFATCPNAKQHRQAAAGGAQ